VTYAVLLDEPGGETALSVSRRHKEGEGVPFETHPLRPFSQNIVLFLATWRLVGLGRAAHTYSTTHHDIISCAHGQRLGHFGTVGKKKNHVQGIGIYITSNRIVSFSPTNNNKLVAFPKQNLQLLLNVLSPTTVFLQPSLSCCSISQITTNFLASLSLSFSPHGHLMSLHPAPILTAS
jgi:hypothetical protein